MAKSYTIKSTMNYSMFTRSDRNRNTKFKKHRLLERSMKKHGFMECFPIVVFRHEGVGLIVKEGQHRLALAQKLGLPVWYIETDRDFDIAEINCTGRGWSIDDFAEMWANLGLEDYQTGIEFAKRHQISLGRSFALLAGTTGYGNIKDAFTNGEFVIKDQDWADRVANLYSQMVALSKNLRNDHFLCACMAVCRVKGFDHDRLVSGSEKCRDKLLSYSKSDSYLVMIEELYNFRRQNLVDIKNKAVMEMRSRQLNGKLLKKDKQEKPIGIDESVEEYLKESEVEVDVLS